MSLTEGRFSKTKNKYNVAKLERDAITSLKNNKDILIKEADNGQKLLYIYYIDKILCF